MQRADLALAEGYQPYAGVLQPLEQRRHVLLVARQAIQRLGHHNIERRLARSFQQCLVSGPQGGGAAERGITIDLDQLPAFGGDPLLADADLVVDRGIALLVAAVAGVDDGAHHDTGE